MLPITYEELKAVYDSLKECKPNVEDFSWGPTLGMAEKRKKEALKILRRTMKKYLE
jgi:hypothetical protein